MKVLHVHSGNLFGGVETMLLLLAKRRDLVPSMSPEFVFSHRGRIADAVAESGALMHDIGAVRTRNPLSIRRGRRNLTVVLGERRPDVVLFHSFWAHALFAAVCRREGVPFVTWVHDLTDGRHWLERWSARKPPARFITSSDYIAAGVRSRYPAVPVTAIHCPVEVPVGPIGRRSDSGDVVIVQVGRLQEWKGHAILIDSLKELRDVPGWRCRIVGGAQRKEEEEYLAALKRQVQIGGIADRVEFMGQRSDVAAILASSDIYCQVNRRPEPFGIAIVEAMLAGLPVITAAMGGALEIVDPRSGVLIDPARPEQFALVLRELISSKKVRETAGAHGAARAAELTDPHTQIARLAETLETAARERR